MPSTADGSKKKSTTQPRGTRKPAGAIEVGIARVVEEWAELQFAPDQIAFQVGIPAERFRAQLEDPGHPHAMAFRRGRLRGEATVAKSLYTLAQQGSGPAQRQFLDRIADRTMTGETLESLVASEKRKETALANMREMDASKMRGELVNAAEVMRLLVGEHKTWRTRMRDLPPRLAPMLVGLEVVEAEGVILRELDAMLTELSDTIPETT